MSITAMKEMANYIDTLGGDSKKYRQAIEQAEKQDVPEVGFGNMEPVAWIEWDDKNNCISVGADPIRFDDQMYEVADGFSFKPLYTTPPAQEFVCSTGLCHYKATSEKRECMNCAAFGECNPNNDAGRCGYEPPAAQSQPEHKGCACRWNAEGDRTVTCERHQGWIEVIAEWADRAREAGAKLKAAAQQEPVAWDTTDQPFNEWWDGDYDDSTNPFDKESPAYWAWAGWQAALHTKRFWVGLTDDDKEELHDSWVSDQSGEPICYWPNDLIEAIEAKLRSKNNG